MLYSNLNHSFDTSFDSVEIFLLYGVSIELGLYGGPPCETLPLGTPADINVSLEPMATALRLGLKQLQDIRFNKDLK